jgi:hypothetical protein
MDHPDYLGDYQRQLQAELDRAAVEVASALRRWRVPRQDYVGIGTSTTIGMVIVDRVRTLAAAELIAPIVRSTLAGSMQYVAVAVAREDGVPWHIDVLASRLDGDIAGYLDEIHWY